MACDGGSVGAWHMMSAIDPPLQEMVYRSLKEDYAAGVLPVGRRLDVQEIADRYRSSKTPAREALCRLWGEGLIEPHPDGGLRLTHYVGDRLIELYAWNMNVLLSLIHEVKPTVLRSSIEGVTPRTLPANPVGISHAVGSIFCSLAAATRNKFAIRTVKNLNERLHYIQIGEIRDLADSAKELRTLTNLEVSDLQKSMRRRVEVYHMRRIDREKSLLM